MNANVRSLSKNLNNLVTLQRLLINEISCIGINKSWLNTSIPTNIFDIHNYVFVHKSRKPERVVVVGIYIKNANKYKEKTDLTIFEDGMFESIFIKIENFNSVKTLIGAIYRPPNHANRDIFLEQMQLIWQNMTMNKNPCYIVGDFNINLLSSEASANFLELMSSHCFKPHISTPTRLNNEGNHASLIDKSSVIQTMNHIPVKLAMTFQIIYLFTTVHVITAITTIITIYLITKLLMQGS